MISTNKRYTLKIGKYVKEVVSSSREMAIRHFAQLPTVYFSGYDRDYIDSKLKVERACKKPLDKLEEEWG